MIFQVFRRLAPRRQVSNSRHYTVPNPQHSIYISNSTNPYFNLTFEDWLFRHKTPEDPLLLIYRDDPCVVIGRNQTPWKEVNFQALRARPDVSFIRRRSGGGTVYHDLGNTNFSIHLPRHSFDRHATAQVILRAVSSLGIDARVNERNDICVGQEKVSGSAYKIVNKRAYHHGTMLISSRLETLGDLLCTNKGTMLTRGVASVRSPVCNLQQFNPEVNHDAFTSEVVKQFRKEYGITSSVQYIEERDDVKKIDYIRRGLEELPSWEWAYGQTPEFTYKVDHSFSWGEVKAEIRSKHGIILSCAFEVLDTHLEESAVQKLTSLGLMFEGKRYGFVGEVPKVPDGSGPRRDVLTWVQEVTTT